MFVDQASKDCILVGNVIVANTHRLAMAYVTFRSNWIIKAPKIVFIFIFINIKFN